MHPVKISNMEITAKDFNTFLDGVFVVSARKDQGCTQHPDPFFVTDQGVPIPSQAMAYIAEHGDLSPNDRVKSTCGHWSCVTPSHLEALPVSKERPTVQYKDRGMRRSPSGRYFHTNISSEVRIAKKQRYLKKDELASFRDCDRCGIDGVSEVWANKHGDKVGLCGNCHKEEIESPGSSIVANRRSRKPSSVGGYVGEE